MTVSRDSRDPRGGRGGGKGGGKGGRGGGRGGRGDKRGPKPTMDEVKNPESAKIAGALSPEVLEALKKRGLIK